MKCDFKAVLAGGLLTALAPALLLYQSGNTSRGTGGGISEYNVDHLGSMATSYLYQGEPKALDILCDYALKRDGNGLFAAAWIDHIAARCGENFDVHLARGRLCAFTGDLRGMRREFAAALALAADDTERARVGVLMLGNGR